MKKTLFALLVLASASLAGATEIPFEVTQGGNFWANSYSFSFMLTSEQLDDLVSGTVLAAYWGTSAGDTYGSNAITLVKSNEGAVTLTIGRGKLNNLSSGAVTTSTTMAYQDHVSFTTTLAADTEYTVSVTGASQAMTPTLTWGAETSQSETPASYNGNMNGSMRNGQPLNSYLNQAYATPEPATATLSLLALAGLAARRRRK